MTGYVRQSAADIVPTAVVRAAPINNEYNALRDAFSATGGHKHDGTTAEGHPVPLIGDSDMLNKIATDTGSNRHGVFVEVGGAAVEQIRFQDGAIVPVTDNDIDLGTSSNEFKNLFITGTANIDSLVADTADINGGTVDNAVIGASTPAAATVTNLTVNTAATIASADINAGTIDGAVIGGSSAQAITGTTVTANTGFVGGLTGDVTGNTAGTHTGAVVGNVTGNLTGNVTASSGSSTFNNVVINGNLNMDASSAATITNLTTPTNAGDAATKGYVDTQVAALVDSAPAALDTLNELAAALGDDASFATNVTSSIAAKLPLAGGTMSGAIAMGTNKITGLGDPSSNQDAATKTYVDTADALLLPKAGGTMSGAIAMGTHKITGMGDPTNAQDAATKNYIDVLFGSTASAAASAAAAATSASNAATSETNAGNSASTASTAATNAAASYDAFDDRYLGSKSSAPSVDNDGNTLLTGALYWNSSSNTLFIWTGSAWTQAAFTASGFAVTGSSNTFTANQIVSVADNTNAAVRITQTGTGNALLVEDAANPDSTPTVIDASGRVIIGNTTTVGNGQQLQTVNADTAAYRASTTVSPSIALARARGTIASPTGMSANDSMGKIVFGGYTTNTAGYVTDPLYAPYIGAVYTNDSAYGGILGGYLALYPSDADQGTGPSVNIKSQGLSGYVLLETGQLALSNSYKEGVSTYSTGTAKTIDLNTGTIQIATLTGNCTFTFPTATAGQGFTLLLKQDATGSRTVTWPSSVKWPSGTAPTITSTALKLDKYVFTSDGTNWYGSDAGKNYTV